MPLSAYISVLVVNDICFLFTLVTGSQNKGLVDQSSQVHGNNMAGKAFSTELSLQEKNISYYQTFATHSFLLSTLCNKELHI